MKKELKLVFIIPELDAQGSGHYYHVYELLQEVGKNIDIFLFAEKGKGIFNKRTIKEVYIQKFSFLPFRFLERYFIFLRQIFRGYKIFYSHQAVTSSLISSSLTRVLAGKTFFWYCGKIHIYEKESGKRNWLFRLNLKLINYLVTAPLEMKKYYQKYFTVPTSKIKLLPGWVNIQRFKKVDKEKIGQLKNKLKLKHKKVILFIHWLSPRKGSRYLPKIIEQTLKKEEDIIFVIIGVGPDFQWLQKELLKRNFLNSVRMLGAVPNQEIPVYFKLADVFILPSKEEELGRVHFEAMAAGVPIVAFSTEGSRALLSKDQKKLMIEKGNIKKFVRAIERGLRERGFFVKQGEKQVQEYSLKNGVNNFLKLIEIDK